MSFATSCTTDDTIRQVFIIGLRNLADYLASNPSVPVPRYGTEIHLHASSTDDGGCAQVDHFARHTGAAIENRLAQSGHYEAVLLFGPVGYRIIAISDARMAIHHASDSYYGCVTPDPVPDTWT
jgi:hypothetical protein